MTDTVFVPKPKVDAAVMHLVPLKQPKINHSLDTVVKIITPLFQTKNKLWMRPMM